MHVWEKGAYYIRVINFSKNYSDVRPTQFTITDLHLSAYVDVLEHTSHTAYINDSFSISSSSVMRQVLIQLSMKGNAGPVTSVLERF